MSTAAMPQTLSTKTAPVAPWFHTIILAFIFLGLAAAGAIFQRRASAHPLSAGSSHIVLYLSLIAMDDGDLPSFVGLLRHDAWLLSDPSVKSQIALVERTAATRYSRSGRAEAVQHGRLGMV